MRLRSLSNRGIGSPYRKPEPTTLDFDALGPGVICFTGPNGAGKTMFLDTLSVALYQKFAYPGRAKKSVYEYAHGTDSMAQALIGNDDSDSITATVRIDAEHRKMERTLDIPGLTQPISGARPYAEEAARRFGTYGAAISTIIGAQGGGGNICEKAEAERKTLFAEFIGAGRYAVYHAAAKAERDRLDGEVATARREMSADELEVEGIGALEEGHKAAGEVRDAHSSATTQAGIAERDAIAAVERAKGAEEKIASLRAAVATATEAVTAAARALTKAEERPGELKAAHEQRLKFIRQQLADADPQAAESDHAATIKGLDARRARLESQLTDLPSVEKTSRDLDAVKGEIAEIEAADRAAQEIGRKVEAAQAKVDTARERLEAARTARAQEIGRLRTQAGLLDGASCAAAEAWIPRNPRCPGPPVELLRTCLFPEAARKAEVELARLEALHGYPEVEPLAEAEEALRALEVRDDPGDPVTRKARHAELATRRDALTRDLARAEAAPQLRDDLAIVIGEREEADRKLDRLRQEAAEKRERAEAQKAEAEEDLVRHLDVAEEALEEAKVDRWIAQKRHATAADTLDKTLADVPVLADAEAALTEAAGVRKSAEEALRVAEADVTRLATQLDALRAKEAALGPKRETLRGLETKLGDWRLLAQATGKDGIPQLLIDAAGPEVSALATEILRGIRDARFALEIVTQGETLEGKATEDFEIVVWDQGERREVGDLSGGEKVMVHRCISLACAIHNRRKSGIDLRFLIEDEPGSALDTETARQYVPMLRKAMEIGGFVQALVISHNPEIVSAADVVVQVADGVLSVEGAAREAA